MNTINKTNSIFFKLIQFATITVFLGRAWQHWRWDAPYRTLLWDEQWMSHMVAKLLGMDWSTYIASVPVENAIQYGIKGIGLFYLSCAVVAFFIKSLPKLGRYWLGLGAISLAILALLYCKERFFSIGQFFEYTLQFGSPLLLIYLTTNPIISNKLLHVIKVAIALTFTAHGLYALGFYPRPVHFMEMTMNILGIYEEQAIQFLNIAGILDFIISIGLFLPWRWAKYCLAYAVFWGASTTAARIWAYFDWEWLDYVLVQWLHESVMRFPHFLVPLAVFVIWNAKNRETKLAS